MSVDSDIERRVLVAVGDAVVVFDRDGRIAAWEGAAQRLLGPAASEVVGRPAADIFPADLLEDLEDMNGAAGVERAERVVALSGEQAAAVTLAPLPDGSGTSGGTTALIKPMGAWLDPAEGAGPPRRRWHRTLGGIVHDLVELAGRDLAAMDSAEPLARLLVRQARRLLPSAECLLSIVPRQRPENFRILAGAGPWAERQVGQEWAQEGTLAGRALKERRAVETVRLQELSALRETLAEGGISSGRLIPLVSQRPLPDGRSSLGVLGFYRSQRAYFTPYERRLADEFVRLVGLALQRTELRRSTIEAAARLRTGVDVALDLSRSLEPAEVIRRLVKRTLSAVGADLATLLLVEGSEAVIVDGHDSAGHAVPVGRRFPLGAVVSDGEPVLELAALDGKPRISGPYRIGGLEPAVEAGLATVKHTLTLPLVLGGSTMGLLMVSGRQDRRFSREDALTLQLVASVAALMLRNARLFAEAQQASQMRSEFLNMAAHELRTPLTVINGYLSMLSDGSLGEPSPRWRETVDVLAVKGSELGRLVDDLLLTSRLESGGLPAHPARVDLRHLLEAAAERARARVELVGGELQLALPAEPVQVAADPDHLSRVLDNLVNNALTYGRPGVPAWVRLEATVEDGTATVAVEDHGRGVPPEMRERIFERFVRAEIGGDPRSGTGLGLYISRQLAARHGGRLELERTVPGEGSRFVLRLPLLRPE